MLLLWSILILLFLFLLISFTILRFHGAEVEKRREIFKEARWDRRHRVPILIENVKPRGENKEIIELRAKLQSGAYTFEEEVKLEKKLTELLAHLFQELEVSDEKKIDALALALQKELTECLSKIRIAQNDYHFALQKFLKLTYPFKISKNKPLELI
jgi:hypothetical protein